MTRSLATTNQRDVERVLSQLDALPPLSPIAAKVLTITDDDTMATSQLIRLIETDPSLSARLLSILHTSEFALPAASLNLGRAVQILGFNRVRQAALALKVMEVFGVGRSKHERNTAFDRDAFWKHCLAVGCAARRLAPAFEIDENDGFVLGLLHDIGKLALNTVMPKSYARVVKQTEDARLDIIAAEQATLGVDHTTAGRYLARNWKLPQRLAQCIWLHHHSPEALPPSVHAGRHVQLVHLADLLARELRLGWSGNYEITITSGELARDLGVSGELLQEVVNALADDLEQRAAWIGGERIDARREYLTALLKTNEQLLRQHDEYAREAERWQRSRLGLTAVAKLNQLALDATDMDAFCNTAARLLHEVFDLTQVQIVAQGINDESPQVEAQAGRRTFDDDEPAGRQQSIRNLTQAISLARFVRFDLTVGKRVTGYLRIPRDERGNLPPDADWEVVLNTIATRMIWLSDRDEANTLQQELATVGKRSEVAHMHAAQRRAIASVTAMAAGAAHELNNPLSVIAGRAQMMAAKCTDADLKKGLTQIGDKARDASSIVNELLAMVTAANPDVETLDLGALINAKLADMASDELWAADAVDIDLPDDLPLVGCDRAHLMTCFEEIFRNAAEAVNGRPPQMTVKAAAHPTEALVVVSVIDNGRGMTPEIMGRAFDPFYSQQPAGRGRGLGLARVQRLMLLNGGDVRLESKPGEGTRVVLRIPTA